MITEQDERLAFTIAGLLRGLRHVAVGASSPIPGMGVLLARALAQARREQALRVSILGSREHNSFTNGGAEIFDMAARGRVDAFFLGGGQIDGRGDINLVGVGDYPRTEVRWPGSFGSAYLYPLIPRVILFRPEHTRRVLVEKVDFVSAAAPRPGDEARRIGGPVALLTSRCLFAFDRARGGFVLRSLHEGHDLDEVREHTGFEFAVAEDLHITPKPDAATLALLRGRIREEIAETYPRFAEAGSG